MKKSLLITYALLYSISASAQVDDVSLTITPTAGYSWFDKSSTVENGAMYGLQAGFGFGKVIELRGLYERSANLKQTFGKYESDVQNHFPGFDFANRSVDVTRIGGEFKTNLPFGRFSPYVLLGTGMQTFERESEVGDDYKSENLYGSGGLGIKLNLSNRTTFNIEGRGLVYNMNPASLLHNPGQTADFDNWLGNQDRNTMYNWTLMAGLQFYFGGRNDRELSDMDRAYLRRFSGGFSGTKVTFSPAAGYLQFNKQSPYRNSYFLGGDVGIDLTDFVGLRGYYYQTTENEKLSLDFDKLAMFGADFVGKLNVPRGIVPYISIGGGYLHAGKDYQNKLSANYPVSGIDVPSSYYAKGGLGIEVPLSPYLQLFGAANIFYTMKNEDNDITSLRHTDELLQHQMYSAGLRFNIGKRADTKVYDTPDASVQVGYDAQVKALEKELKTAYEKNDTDKVIEIMEKKKAIDSMQNLQHRGETKYIRLTPAELESLIDKVLDGLEDQHELSLEDRLNRIERLLLQESPKPITEQIDTLPVPSARDQQTEYNIKTLQKEIELLRQRLQDQENEINDLKNKQGVLTPLQSETQPGVNALAFLHPAIAHTNDELAYVSSKATSRNNF